VGPEGGLARALGVTRVARVTGLDRTGVEVASAVRPRAHVLQVTNGKGERWEDAALGALMEAAELAAAERAVAEAWDSTAALAARLGRSAVVSPRAIDPDGAEGWDGVRIAWRRAVDLATGAPVLVPAQAVHVPPAGGPSLGPSLLRWTSNGMGTGSRGRYPPGSRRERSTGGFSSAGGSRGWRPGRRRSRSGSSAGGSTCSFSI
jgi:ribosomal protein S12 methylthiotransferase accessory factor